MRIAVVLGSMMLALVACQAPTTSTAATSTINTGVNPTATAAAPGPTTSNAVPKPTATAVSAAETSPPSVSATRIDTLNVANAAFTRGDLSTASGLYERVLNTPPTGESATVTAAINGFASFRDVVTLLADGREDDAKAQVDALQQADATGAFTRLAAQLWDQYSMVGAVRGACSQIQPQITSQAGPTLRALQAAGVSVDPATLCSVPS
jgi:hypothetical protein